MASFTEGTNFQPGDIVATETRSPVGGSLVTRPTRGGKTTSTRQGATPIFHRTVTKITSRDSSGRVTGAETQVWIVKNGSYQLAATTKDGGKTFTYEKDSDENFVGGDDFRKDLSNPQSQINQTVDTQVENVLNKRSDILPEDKAKIIDKTKNQAGQSNEEDPQGGSSPTSEDGQSGIDIDNIKIEADQRTGYDKLLKYPEDLETQYQDYFKIMMVEYKPRGLSAAGGALSSRTNLSGLSNNDAVGDRKILANIILPIPGGIGDSNNLDWQGDSMDMLQLMGADILQGGITGGGEGAGDATGRVSNTVANNTGAMQEMATSAIVKNVTGVDRLKRMQGAIFNNNMELLFNGPQLRSFSFTFRLSPRSATESKIVQKIIRTLKQGMSAKKANNFLFIKSPHTFFLGYYKNQSIHPYLNKFKECALTGMSMAYTPDGNYATFYDGSMTSYQMTLTFQELEPVFDSDYGSDYQSIGY